MAAASIVRDGVAGGAGSLFQDVKFWISRRVPMRERWTSLVENNGGKVVPLEKSADVLIADHAKPSNAPAGALSWRYIDESVKHGVLEDSNVHLVRAQPGAPREASSNQPAKSSKRPFTHADDVILAQWVNGAADTSGNSLYQKLEKEHPHHPWQSWRDRWLKRVRYQPPGTPAVDEAPPPPRRAAPVAPSPRRSPVRAQSPVSKGYGRSRSEFTKADDEIIVRFVKELSAAGIPCGISNWRELEIQFPHHTAESWRTRWLKAVSKSPELQSLVPRRRSVPQPGPNVGSNKTPPVESPVLASSNRKTATARAAVSSSPPAVSSLQPPRSRLSRPSLRELKGQYRNAAAEIIQRAWRGHAARQQLQQTEQSLTALQSLAKGFTTRNALRQTDESLPGERNDMEHPEPERTRKQEFYHALQEYIDTQGANIELWPTIGRRAIELWDLYEAVRLHESDPGQRDWQQIAESLGLDWIQDPNVAELVRTCYIENLEEFEQLCNNYADESSDDDGSDDDGSGDDGNDDDDQDTQEVNGDGQEVSPRIELYRKALRAEKVAGTRLGPRSPSEPEFPSSPPPQANALKRTYETAMPSADPTYPAGLPRKRPKPRDYVIQSTPEEQTGDSRVAHPIPDSSPTMRHLRSDRDDRTTQAVEQWRQIRGSRTTEPETQDYRFEPATQDPLIMKSQQALDVTPSQQLRQEDMASINPVPLHLPRPTPRVAVAKPRTEVKGTPAKHSEQRVAKVPGSPNSAAEQRNGALARHVAPKTSRRTLPPSFGQGSRRPRHPRTSGSKQQGASRQMDSAPSEASVEQSVLDQAAMMTPRDNDKEVEIAEFIEHFESMGYPREIVIDGLKAANGNPGLAGIAMESLKKGVGIPSNHEGIWTREDDERLELVNSFDWTRTIVTGEDRKRLQRAEKAKHRLEHKHGVARMEERMEYMGWEAED